MDRSLCLISHLLLGQYQALSQVCLLLFVCLSTRPCWAACAPCVGKRRCEIRQRLLSIFLKILFRPLYLRPATWSRCLCLRLMQGFLMVHNTYGQKKAEISVSLKRVLKSAQIRSKLAVVNLSCPTWMGCFSWIWMGGTKSRGCFRILWSPAFTWICQKKVVTMKFWL